MQRSGASCPCTPDGLFLLHPSIGTVARELQLSRRTVVRVIDDLVRAGLITKTVLAGERWAEQPAFYSERPLNLKKEMPPRGKCALLAA